MPIRLPHRRLPRPRSEQFERWADPRFSNRRNSTVTFFSNLSIRSKILAAFAVVLIAAAGLGLFAIDRLATVNGSAAEVRDNWLPATGWLGVLAKTVEQVSLLQAMHVMDKSAADKQSGEAAINAALKKFDDTWKLYEPTVTTATEGAFVTKFKKSWGDYLDQSKELIALSRKDQTEAAVALFVGKMRDQFSVLRGVLEEDLNFNVEAGKKEADNGAEVFRSAKTGIVGALVLTALLCAVMGFMIILGIARPLGRLTGGMLRLADGDFDVILPGLGRKDEVGAMAQAVQTFKVKAAERAQAEAQQKVEQDHQAAAERDAAMARMADEFQAAVGGIVESAVAGDFSKRVELAGKTGMVLNVGTSINALCENVAKALNDLIQMLSALADGDLTKRVTGDYQGDFATIKVDANRMAEQLTQTVSDIMSVGREVANAAAEISTSTTDLSQRTEEQAASLEQTSASMEEMSATVKKNAENASQANRLTSGSRDTADRGGQVVAKAVDAMARIEESSRKISDIIGVIDEIARQTNLLALNAAVEAARAGDAGRGFAVVASEVRSLAQRSSQAAKDIKDLITNSSSQVQEGVGLVNQAGTSLNEITGSIKQVADIVAEIASASQEQSTGIDQINKALNQMDEVTQQNSALVEENAASAKTLESQSEQMNEKVAFFKLDEHGARRAAKSPAPAPRLVANPAKREAVPARKAVVAAVNGRRGGPVGRMQAAVATAVAEDKDWKEF
jgi:methyl-accepting chemotaxis protein